MSQKFFSFLDLSKLQLLALSNNKFFYKSKVVTAKRDYTKDYQLGGQDNYFINLSRAAYRQDDKLTERTWKFLFKYSVVARQIFHKAEEKNKAVNVLDIGCSKGFLRRVLESNVRGGEKIIYVGTDLSKSKLEEAVFNEDSLESGAEGDKIPSAYIWHNVAKKLPLKSRSFDFVVCFQMIKYLSKKETIALLEEIFRVLKNGGLFFLSTDPVYDKNNYLNFQKKQELEKKGYKSFWSAKDIIEILEQIGFKELPIFISALSDKASIEGLYSIFPKEIIDGLLSICYPQAEIERFFILGK